MKSKCKSAMITVELAVSLVLVVVVLFVTLGLFGDNIKDMVANGNIKNIFNGESIRTFFASWNKDYSGSQIDVQVMGEQGLEQLRKKANNNSNDLIKPYDSGEGIKTITPDSTANTIAYLAKMIYVIVGDYKVCSYMKDDSKKPCLAIGLTEKYNVQMSGNSLTILAGDKPIAIGSIADTGAMPAYNSDTSATQKWQDVQSIQAKYSNVTINNSYALTQNINAYNAQLNVPTGKGTSKIEDEIIALLGNPTPTAASDENHAYSAVNNIIKIATAASRGCSGKDISCDTGGAASLFCTPSDKCSQHITSEDLVAIGNDITQMTAKILEQAKQADTLANPDTNIVGYLHSSNYYSPSYNSYASRLNTGSQSSIVSGASTALLTPSLPISKNGEPVVAGSSDAMIARYVLEDPIDGYDDICDRPVPPRYCGVTYPEPPVEPLSNCVDPNNSQCSVTYTPTPNVTYTFAKEPIVTQTPADPRLALVPNTDVGMDVRAAILITYVNMTNAVFPKYNSQSALTSDLIYRMNKDHISFKDDSGNDTYLCLYAVNKLADIASKYGLLSAHDDIISHLSQCYGYGYGSR